MADFCLDCSNFLFGGKTNGAECDFAGLLTKEEVEQGLVVTVVCEGCGFIQVDHNGQKVPWLEDEGEK